MISYLLLISSIGLIYAFDPPCSTCKFFIPHKVNPDLGLCGMIQDKIYLNNNEFMVKNLALHCRNNENLCGKSGFLHESNYNSKVENYEYIQSLCCGELTDEKDLEELEQIEKDLVDIFQKMRKHNTKKIYKTSKEIYKLFKKNKE
jgi:hypothetical protein